MHMKILNHTLCTHYISTKNAVAGVVKNILSNQTNYIHNDKNTLIKAQVYISIDKLSDLLLKVVGMATYLSYEVALH